MASQVEASVELPASAVEGYTLMLVHADGTESPVELSRNEETGKVFFKLDLTSGAQLLRLAANS